MNTPILRTLQVAVALIVVAIVILAVLLLTGVIGQETAVNVAWRTGAVIGICAFAGIVLGLVFGTGRNDDGRPR